jgi:hypothetical protein
MRPLLLGATEAARRTGGSTSQVEVLEVGKPLPRVSLLAPATRVYLRHKIVGNRRETVDLWRRKISFEDRYGRRLLRIVTRSQSVGDQKFSQSSEFWFEPETFRPVSVQHRITQGGNTAMHAYRYRPDRVEGIPEVHANSQKDFVQLTNVASYYWEADIELLQTLPLGVGYAVKIPLYEAGPGNHPPRYYRYKIVGQDSLVSADGNASDCSIFGIDSDDPHWGPARLWYTKEDQLMIREETRPKVATIGSV